MFEEYSKGIWVIRPFRASFLGNIIEDGRGKPGICHLCVLAADAVL